MRLSMTLALLLFAALPAHAQPALQACFDVRRQAAARVSSCNEALRLQLAPAARAAALRGRAEAGHEAIMAQADAPGAAMPPPAAFDRPLADARESARIASSSEVLSLIALIRLDRGDLSDAARRASFARDQGRVVQALGEAIERGPVLWEHYLARGMTRSFIGAPGADADFMAARRLLFGAR